MAGKHQRSRASPEDDQPPPADDHELRRKCLETAAQIIVRVATYIIITHWRHWGL